MDLNSRVKQTECGLPKALARALHSTEQPAEWFLRISALWYFQYCSVKETLPFFVIDEKQKQIKIFTLQDKMKRKQRFWVNIWKQSKFRNLLLQESNVSTVSVGKVAWWAQFWITWKDLYTVNTLSLMRKVKWKM